MGEPEKADRALLPQLPWFSDSTYLQLRGYLQVDCNYMLLQENVLDLTHLPHLHGQVQFEGWEGSSPEVKTTDRTVTYVLTLPDVQLSPAEAIAMGIEAGKRIKRVDWGTFASPACHVSGNDLEDLAPAAGARRHFIRRALHCTTPSAVNRCHYWWALAQDHGQQVPQLKERMRDILNVVFKQDRDVLEATQRSIEHHERGEPTSEVLVRADRAVFEARRILQTMLEADSP
jgi:vanillate O-demethylase monooxygenase subunit